MFTKSIRGRMLLWLAFLLGCILTGFGVTAYQLNRINLLRQIDEELTRRIAALNADVRIVPRFGDGPGRPPFEPERRTNQPGFDFGPPRKRPPTEPDHEMPPPRRPGPEMRGRRGPFEERGESRSILLSEGTLNLFDEWDTNGFFYAVWSRSGNVLKQSTNAPAGLARPEQWANSQPVEIETHGYFRQASLNTDIGECVLVGRSIRADLAALRRYAWLLAAAGIAVLALGLGGGWLLATRALRPVSEISVAAGRISLGNLAERINVNETDSELGRLAAVLNSTFARLEAAFAQQKQFTADASHELRTPLAVIISEAQTALARERTASEYRETVEGCLEAAQQMKRLTQSLLELARYDAGQEILERQPFDLAERTGLCIDLVQPLARERGIQIQRDLSSITVWGDADRLAQVIVNLLNNAVFYNRERGEIRVSTRLDHKQAILTVTDSGPGIAPEDLPHVFERFYRADKSRGRAEGRSGLGLAISKAIMDAHGGSIDVTSQPGIGSTFTVRLPAGERA